MLNVAIRNSIILRKWCLRSLIVLLYCLISHLLNYMTFSSLTNCFGHLFHGTFLSSFKHGPLWRRFLFHNREDLLAIYLQVHFVSDLENECSHNDEYLVHKIDDLQPLSFNAFMKSTRLISLNCTLISFQIQKKKRCSNSSWVFSSRGNIVQKLACFPLYGQNAVCLLLISCCPAYWFCWGHSSIQIQFFLWASIRICYRCAPCICLED